MAPVLMMLAGRRVPGPQLRALAERTSFDLASLELEHHPYDEWAYKVWGRELSEYARFREHVATGYPGLYALYPWRAGELMRTGVPPPTDTPTLRRVALAIACSGDMSYLHVDDIQIYYQQLRDDMPLAVLEWIVRNASAYDFHRVFERTVGMIRPKPGWRALLDRRLDRDAEVDQAKRVAFGDLIDYMNGEPASPTLYTGVRDFMPGALKYLCMYEAYYQRDVTDYGIVKQITMLEYAAANDRLPWALQICQRLNPQKIYNVDHWYDALRNSCGALQNVQAVIAARGGREIWPANLESLILRFAQVEIQTCPGAAEVYDHFAPAVDASITPLIYAYNINSIAAMRLALRHTTLRPFTMIQYRDEESGELHDHMLGLSDAGAEECVEVTVPMYVERMMTGAEPAERVWLRTFLP